MRRTWRVKRGQNRVVGAFGFHATGTRLSLDAVRVQALFVFSEKSRVRNSCYKIVNRYKNLFSSIRKTENQRKKTRASPQS